MKKINQKSKFAKEKEKKKKLTQLAVTDFYMKKVNRNFTPYVQVSSSLVKPFCRYIYF